MRITLFDFRSRCEFLRNSLFGFCRRCDFLRIPLFHFCCRCDFLRNLLFDFCRRCDLVRSPIFVFSRRCDFLRNSHSGFSCRCDFWRNLLFDFSRGCDCLQTQFVSPGSDFSILFLRARLALIAQGHSRRHSNILVSSGSIPAYSKLHCCKNRICRLAFPVSGFDVPVLFLRARQARSAQRHKKKLLARFQHPRNFRNTDVVRVLRVRG